MNHPTREQLSDFIYDELDATDRAEVEQHLRACSTCAEQVKIWADVRRRLGSWQLSDRSSRRARMPLASGLRTAVAAMLLICMGYGIARMTAPQVDVSTLRAELSRDLATQVQRDLSSKLATFSAEQASYRQDLQQAVQQSLDQLAAQQVAFHTMLRKDVETVALHTQAEFERLASADHPVTDTVGSTNR